MENNEYILKPEGRYRVYIDEQNDFTGIFKGYSSLCGETAMVIEVNGRLKFIPIAQILFIDQIDIPKSEEAPKKVDIYYR